MIAYQNDNVVHASVKNDFDSIISEEFCKTGIDELDLKLGGGIPSGNTVLMVGSSGSGKTTLSMQFLANGAKMGERGVFFTITEPLFKLTKNMENFSFYDKKMIEEGNVNIIDLRIISERLGLDAEKYSVEDATALLDVLKDIADELQVKRLVIDSITALCYRLKSNENFILPSGLMWLRDIAGFLRFMMSSVLFTKPGGYQPD